MANSFDEMNLYILKVLRDDFNGQLVKSEELQNFIGKNKPEIANKLSYYLDHLSSQKLIEHRHGLGIDEYIILPIGIAHIEDFEKESQDLRVLESLPIAKPTAQKQNKVMAIFIKAGLWIISHMVQIIVGALGTILGAYYIIKCNIPH